MQRRRICRSQRCSPHRCHAWRARSRPDGVRGDAGGQDEQSGRRAERRSCTSRHLAASSAEQNLCADAPGAWRALALTQVPTQRGGGPPSDSRPPGRGRRCWDVQGLPLAPPSLTLFLSFFHNTWYLCPACATATPLSGSGGSRATPTGPNAAKKKDINPSRTSREQLGTALSTLVRRDKRTHFHMTWTHGDGEIHGESGNGLRRRRPLRADAAVAVQVDPRQVFGQVERVAE